MFALGKYSGIVLLLLCYVQNAVVVIKIKIKQNKIK